MYSLRQWAVIGTALCMVSYAAAADPFTVSVEELTKNRPISSRYALCKATTDGKSTNGENNRPAIAWQNAPKETKSFVVIVSDPDVPASFADAGKEGKTIAHNAPRQMFYHWGVINIQPTINRIPGGPATSPVPGTPVTNDLGGYLPDATLYGGPCPPWNDERPHNYHFTVYALNVANLDLTKDATAKNVVAKIKEGKNALAEASVIGTFTLNPRVESYIPAPSPASVRK